MSYVVEVEYEDTVLRRAKVEIDLVELREWLNDPDEAITADVIKEFLASTNEPPETFDNQTIDSYQSEIVEVHLP